MKLSKLKKLPVHPLADSFPMLMSDELQELADDIVLNGLNHPIIVGDIDGTEMLIDGRNRLAACVRAKIEPAVKQLNGADAVSLIVSENLMRRHLNMSQKAVLMAMANPEGKSKAGRNSSAPTKLGVKNGSPNTEYMRQARFLVNPANKTADLAQLVLDNAKSLTVAYDKARERVTTLDANNPYYETLRREAPALAERVDAGEDLVMLYKHHMEAENSKATSRLASFAALQRNLSGITILSAPAILERLTDDIREYPKEVIKSYGDDTKQLRDDITTTITTLTRLLEGL